MEPVPDALSFFTLLITLLHILLPVCYWQESSRKEILSHLESVFAPNSLLPIQYRWSKPWRQIDEYLQAIFREALQPGRRRQHYLFQVFALVTHYIKSNSILTSAWSVFHIAWTVCLCVCLWCTFDHSEASHTLRQRRPSQLCMVGGFAPWQ